MYITETQTNDIALFLQKIEDLENKFQYLQTEYKTMRDRLTYLEYDLHTKNQQLRDENFYFRQEVDYSSQDYCSHEDSWQGEH
jgi:hypothetical protein